MTRAVSIFASLLALVAAATPGLAGEQTAKEDCGSRIQKLDASNAEGEERLDEKNAVIAICTNQYKRDRTIGDLVKACAKYEEQPVIKQQAVAECQLAAFNYAEALRTLKADYGK
jgi:hypothetical protein